MEMQNYLAQGIGYFAVIAMIVSLQKKNKDQILIYQIIYTTLFSIQYLLLSALSGAVINAIATVRTIIFYKTQKNDENVNNNTSFYIFLVILGISGYFTYNGIYSLLPIICSLITIIVTWFGKASVIRCSWIFLAPLWFIYDYVVGSMPGMVSDILMLVSAVVGVIRYDLKKSVESYQ